MSIPAWVLSIAALAATLVQPFCRYAPLCVGVLASVLLIGVWLGKRGVKPRR